MSKSKARKKRRPKWVLALRISNTPGQRPEQPDVCQRAANLRPRDSRVRRPVLFGAPPRVQPHRRAPVLDSPRTTQVRAGHDQSSARRGPADRVRVAGSRDGRDVDWCGLRRGELLALRLESIQTTCGAPAPVSAISQAANWIRSSSCSATSPSRQPNATPDASRSSGLP